MGFSGDSAKESMGFIGIQWDSEAVHAFPCNNTVSCEYNFSLPLPIENPTLLLSVAHERHPSPPGKPTPYIILERCKRGTRIDQVGVDLRPDRCVQVRGWPQGDSNSAAHGFSRMLRSTRPGRLLTTAATPGDGREEGDEKAARGGKGGRGGEGRE